MPTPVGSHIVALTSTLFVDLLCHRKGMLWLGQKHLPALYASQQALTRAARAAGVQHVRHNLQRGEVNARTEVPALPGEHNLQSGALGG